MQRILIDLNQNVLLLTENLSQFLAELFDTKFRALADKFLLRITQFFVDMKEAIEQLKFGKATEIILAFLEEVENLLNDIYSRFDIPLESIVGDFSREVIQLIKLQVTLLDQKRQSYFAF